MLDNEKKREAKRDATEEASEERKSWTFRLQLAKCEPFFGGSSRAAIPVHLALARTFS